jgi:hypothetical protein
MTIFLQARQHTLTLRGSNLRLPLTRPSDAETRRELAVPKLQAMVWDNKPHSIAVQRGFTTPRLLITGLDASTSPNGVLVRHVNSTVEFKQFIWPRRASATTPLKLRKYRRRLWN